MDTLILKLATGDGDLSGENGIDTISVSDVVDLEDVPRPV